MIYKLQKRNEELEDMLLQRDLQNAKRFNDIKTMCIYGHVDYKVSSYFPNTGNGQKNIEKKNCTATDYSFLCQNDL